MIIKVNLFSKNLRKISNKKVKFICFYTFNNFFEIKLNRKFNLKTFMDEIIKQHNKLKIYLDKLALTRLIFYTSQGKYI